VGVKWKKDLSVDVNLCTRLVRQTGRGKDREVEVRRFHMVVRENVAGKGEAVALALHGRVKRFSEDAGKKKSGEKGGKP